MGAAGIVVAITLNVDPVHDIGFFVFEGSWIALGITILGVHRPQTASVPV